MNTEHRPARPTVTDAHTTPNGTLVISLSNGATIKSRNNDYQWVFVYAWTPNVELRSIGTRASASIYKRTNARRAAVTEWTHAHDAVNARTRGDYILLRRCAGGTYEEVTAP